MLARWRGRGPPGAFLLASGLFGIVYTVGPESVGVIQRFGRAIDTAEPGLRFKLPFGIDRVTIVPVKVLDCAGRSQSYSVELGIDWVITNHTAGAPAVANLSLSGGLDPYLNGLVDAMVADGITVVVAAGNNGQNACSYSPASAGSVITVGATFLTAAKTDERASFSNFGSCLDVYAPGVGVLSASGSSDSATATLQGTSMASPHAAGVAALIMSTGVTSPGAVAAKLQNTADPMACPADTSIYDFFPAVDNEAPQVCQGGTGYNSFNGHGQVNALSAVTR